MFDAQCEQLLQSLDAAHAAYYGAKVFNGPSLFFHLKALEFGKNGNFDRFSETVYALLAAWGMHRMGRGGSKMCEFEEFQASLKPLWPTLLKLQRASPDDLDDDAWRDLEAAFREIRCMQTRTSLVGNSKVMAHVIPNLVPPVDREYTLKFLYRTGNITNGLDREWRKLRTILVDFFYPVLRSDLLQARAAEWMSRSDVFRWDTSPLKVVDNLLIGHLRRGRAENRIEEGIPAS